METNRKHVLDELTATPSDPGTGPPKVDRRRRVFSVDEVAMILGISRAHAYELIARNELRHVRLGRRILIPVAVVDELLDVALS